MFLRCTASDLVVVFSSVSIGSDGIELPSFNG